MSRAPDSSRHSIRRRLLRLLLLPVAAVLALGTAFDFRAFEQPVEKAYDTELSNAALALALSAGDGSDVRNLLATDRSGEVYFRIDTPGTTAIAGNADLPVVAQGSNNPSIATLAWNDRKLRVASYRTTTPGGTLTATVAETFGKRDRLNSQLLRTTIWTDLLGLAAILASLWVGIRLALKPLDDLAGEVGRRGTGDLSPIDPANAPMEARGLVLRLNELLATVQASSKAERQFLESAAHQLRTPLTGVLAQLELLADSETDPVRRAQLQVTLATERALSHTTHQLLSLARAEHRACSITDAMALDLSDLAMTSLANATGKAAAASVELVADLQEARIVGVEWLIIEAITNLLDNAITYTPAGGSVTVRTGMSRASPFLEVLDTGHGIPPEEQTRVVDRFYRGSHAQGAGSGLGLAIVSDVAAQHGATLTISNGDSGTGTRVRLSFNAGSAPEGG